MEHQFFLPPTAAQLLATDPASLDDCGKELVFCAWVRSRRDSKNVSFLNLNDGSCTGGIQAVVGEGCAAAEFSQVDNGAAVRLHGVLVPSQGKGQAVEIRAKRIELLGGAPQDEYPLQKKRHSFEFLREIGHLRSRSNSIGAVVRLRNRMSMLVHEFFQQHGFYYLHTPIITLSDAEGAGEMFGVESTAYQGKRRFFGQEAFLTVSGQLENEAYAHSHARVYAFGPTFRAEESDTARHLAEFWMIEPEVAFMELEGLMELAESLIRYLIAGALEHCPEELALLNKWVEPKLLASLQGVLDSQRFVRLSYTEAIALLEKAVAQGREFVYPVAWGDGLQTEHERWLTEEHFVQPVVVYNYPAAGKAFYMKQNEDGRTVRGMDLLLPRLGEIVGGSQREDDYHKLRSRMQQADMELANYQWYLDLRRFGGVPHSGFGLGFERLLQYLSGMKNIREVIPFPRALGRAY